MNNINNYIMECNPHIYMDKFANQFTVMMLAISTVLDIVQIVSSFFAKQATSLGACYMELLLTSRFIALHACTGCSL